MSLFFAMIKDTFDFITAFLMIAEFVCHFSKTRRNFFPFLICGTGTIALFYILPIWAVQYLFRFLTPFLSNLFICLFLFSCLYGLRIWTYLPIPMNRRQHFFLYLTIGWVMIRWIFWLFIYIQATLDSPFIRFQMDGPVTASIKAEAWNFSHLQMAIDTTVAKQSKSLHTETEYSKKQIELLVDGLEQAETFRQRLLITHPSGKTQAQVITQAIIAFQKSANQQLQDHIALDDFFFVEEELVDAISGNAGEVIGSLSFELFQGKWYGEWDSNDVDHDWSETQEFHPYLVLDTQPPMGLRAVQYAWIGDGFGWNAVIAPNCQNTGDVILGTVYHVRNQDPDDIYLHRPHVGIALDAGQLIWITQSEIFLEQAFPDDDPEDVIYAITGFYYEIKDGKLQNNGDGFQAVYSRKPGDRPKFYRYPIQVSIDL